MIPCPSAHSDMAVYKSERGGFEYSVTRKRVKNINLRVRADGSVAVSAPNRIPESVIISFVEEKSLKIAEVLRGMRSLTPEKQYTQNQKTAFLEKAAKICREIEPLFFCGDYKKPKIELCSGKSRWGYCVPVKNLVRLNISLSDFSDDVIKYVAMHEYCHFICQDHSESFYRELTQRMPHWKKYKKILKENNVKNDKILDK